MSKTKRKLEDILYSLSYEERVCYLIDELEYSSEDAYEYAKLFEPND